MMTKKPLVLLTVVAFSLGTAGLGLAAALGDEVKGTVTRIEDYKVTIEDGTGMEKTVEPKNPEALKELKVGDHVVVKEDVLRKTNGAGPSPPGGSRY